MWRIGITGDSEETLIRLAKERLHDKAESELIFEPWKEAHQYDAVIILPDADPENRKIRCRILVIPDNIVPADAEAVSVVSYGLSPKNTVTLSSSKDDSHVIALQRDVVSLAGTLILRQEFAISCDLSQTEALEMASLMIITGVLES